jgi:hypothetical protein
MTDEPQESEQVILNFLQCDNCGQVVQVLHDITLNMWPNRKVYRKWCSSCINVHNQFKQRDMAKKIKKLEEKTR